MAKSQELADFEQVVEKIVFDADELEHLKIAIKNFTEGKTSAKELKHLLLQCRGRMVEDMTEYLLFMAKKLAPEKTIVPAPSTSVSQIESQLREEIREKNELLETVALRVNQMVSNLDNEDRQEDQRPISIDDIKKEIERCLNLIGGKEWIEMCYYDDYKFFVKLYPKLEALYEERFYESEKNSKNTTEGKEIMANKMVKLGFPKDIETIVINYISIRNNFQHSMVDISPLNLELARDAFAKVFVYLILSSIESKFLLNNRETLFANLTEFFSKRLTGNLAYRKRILERIEAVFQI